MSPLPPRHHPPLHRLLAVVALVAALVVASPAAGGGATAAGPLATPSAAASTCAISAPSGAFAQRVAVSPGHAQIWRQYQAFFLRQPDEGGLAHWYGVRARGSSLSDIAYSFSVSDEFRRRYGSLSDGGFVDLVYANVQCRRPDASGRAYWLDLLRSGRITRWDMVVTFAELGEYMGRTRTCHSATPGVEDGLAHCARAALRPLHEADLARDGYRARSFTVPRVGGGSGVLRGMEVDVGRGLLWTSSQRCSVASVNGVWIAETGKDGPTPSINGLGLVDGVHARGSADRLDRGVLGLRFDTAPRSHTEAWPGDTGGETRQRISHILHHDGWVTIDSWHATAEQSPYLQMRQPDAFVGPDEWIWAVSGMPFRINGQTNESFDRDYANDPYTNQTRNHSVLAFDTETGVAFVGATSTLDTRDLVRFAEARGWEDLVKFDGGASTELNEGGRAVVAGTSRAVPVWLGIGC